MANTVEVRRENRRQIAEFLLQHPNQTQLTLQHELGLSNRTILELLKELRQQELVEETKSQKKTVGRPSAAWSLKADARYFLGVRVLRDQLALAVLNLRMELVDYRTVSLSILADYPPEMQQQILRQAYRAEHGDTDYYTRVHHAIVEEVQKYLTSERIPQEKVVGLGVAVSGSISGEIWQFCEYVRNVREEAAWMEQALSFPVKFLRDEQQCGIAEAWHAGFANAVCLFLDWGVGGMAMQQYETWNGDSGHALSIGHMILHPGGRTCICGKRGCFGSYCSATSLLNAGYSSLDGFFHAKRNGDPQAQAVWEAYLCDLTDGICTLTALFDVPIIISGIMADYLEPEMEAVLQKIAKREGTDFPVRLHLGYYREKADTVGAALYWHKWYMKHQI